MIKKITLLLFMSCLITTTSNSQSVNQIIVGANNNGAVFSANLDGSNPSVVNTDSGRFSYYGSVADNAEQKVFMAWYYGIYAMNYDGSNWQKLLTLADGYGSAVDIDPANNKVYYALNGISRMNYDGTNQENVVNLSGYNIEDIQLDLANNQVYFATRFGTNLGLFRVNLDGTNLVNIVSERIANFKINFDESLIFFAAGMEAEGKVSDFEGNVTTLFNNQVGEFDFDLENDKVYFTDMSNKAIKRADYDGSNVEVVVASQDIMFDSDPMDTPSGLVLVNNSTLSTQPFSKDTSVLKLYPNPTSNFITIDGLESEEQYTLTTTLGQVLKQGHISKNSSISVEELQNGVFILKLKSGSSFKFVKQ
jgi:hypothetical protein